MRDAPPNPTQACANAATSETNGRPEAVALQNGDVQSWRAHLDQFRVRNGSTALGHLYYWTLALTLPTLGFAWGLGAAFKGLPAVSQSSIFVSDNFLKFLLEFPLNVVVVFSPVLALLVFFVYPLILLLFSEPPRGRWRRLLFCASVPAVAFWAATSHPDSFAQWLYATTIVQIAGMPLGIGLAYLAPQYRDVSISPAEFAKHFLACVLVALPMGAGPVIFAWPVVRTAVGTDVLNYLALIATLAVSMLANFRRISIMDFEGQWFNPAAGVFVVPYLIASYLLILPAAFAGAVLRGLLGLA